MNRTKIAVGAALTLAGLAAFGLQFESMHAHGSYDTYWLLRDGDLERSAAGLLSIVAGLWIMLTAKRA